MAESFVRGAFGGLPPATSPAAAAAGDAIVRLAEAGEWTARQYPLVGGGGRVARNFGQLRGPPSARRRHKGVDIWAIPQGTLIQPANPGVVERVYRDRRHATGYGLVLLTHNGRYREYYFHMRDAPSAADGQPVTLLLPIGRVGMTGRADGPHLHFQVFDVARSAYVNPYSALVLARAATSHGPPPSPSNV